MEKSPLEYTRLSPYILETPRTNSSGKPIDFQRIEGIGVVSWSRIRLIRYSYGEKNTGDLYSIVTVELERIQ